MDFGGKANSLLKLKDCGFNVPNFFVVSSSEYIEFLEYNKIKEKVLKLSNENKYDELKNLIMKLPLPNKLEKNILQKYGELGSKYVSVRSSASNEDGENKSFAGQYNSYLNVDKDNIIESIKKCWCSLYEENILSYEKEPNLYGMNVIIQKMINSSYAGVAFSIDPTSDTNNYTVIEMIEGLGEKLVSGMETPTKFLVRRQTKTIDLKIGDLEIDDKIIEDLENVVLSIEKTYGMPVDIEYAIEKGNIYILQTRPISKMTITKKAFELSITRPHTLIEEEIYFKGEHEGIKSLTNGYYYFKPLFVYDKKNKTTKVYYNMLDLEEDPYCIYSIIDDNFKEFKNKYVSILNDIKYVEKIINDKKEINIDNIIDILIKAYPFTSLGQLAGHFSPISDRVKKILMDYRNNYDNFVHDTCEYLENCIKNKLNDSYKKYFEFLTLDEINNLPKVEDLIKRSKGYIYYGKLYTDDYKKTLNNLNIELKEDEEISNLEGSIAYSGDVKGRVCIIYSEKDFNKFRDNDILVTPMTVPKFTSLIKRASAIITDEGGITCHASIIARELQIPCVVGTKFATKVLKDNYIVEMDGSTGKIKIIQGE